MNTARPPQPPTPRASSAAGRVARHLDSRGRGVFAGLRAIVGYVVREELALPAAPPAPRPAIPPPAVRAALPAARPAPPPAASPAPPPALCTACARGQNGSLWRCTLPAGHHTRGVGCVLQEVRAP